MSRRGFTVALVGPDGAGKTTICRKLLQQLPWPSTHIYMGINQDACNVLLPTTWLWLRFKKLLGLHSSMGGPPPVPESAPAKRFNPLRTVKSLLRTANLLAEEWYRQLVCWFAVRSGKIVIMDRHFLLDYYAHDVSSAAHQRTLARRIHGYFLRRFPIPDLIVLLDMSPELLFERKPEGTVEALARRRQEYLELQHKFPNLLTIDAAQPLDIVVCQVLDAITLVHAHIGSGVSSSAPETAQNEPAQAEQRNSPQVRWSYAPHSQCGSNHRSSNSLLQGTSPPRI